MCGIAGQMSFRETVSAADVERALPLLHHRGPDENHTWTSADRRVCFGHTRLSIIGLDNGRQPLANEKGDIHAVVNGELYDFEAIRDQLRAQGHRFLTESDSEIAMHLYEDLGTACLSRLRGEFAMVLWDAANQTLFAARDRFGIKPLYYAQHNGRFFFASEVKALFAMGVPAEWDLETVFHMNSGYVMQAHRTLFKGVFAVPPGHYLLLGKNELRVIKYWDFDYRRKDDPRPVPAFSEAVEEVRARITEAIKIRLRADVPVGVYLSGGLDSCAVLGVASRIAGRPLDAFTLSFESADYDEREIAREMAAHAGARFHPISIRARDLADNLRAAIIQGETLVSNSHSAAKYLLSRAVREAGFKVVLTGEGSDEVFAGYPPFKRDMILYNTKDQDPAVVRELLAELDRTNTVSKGLMLAEDQGVLSGVLSRALGFVPSYLEAFLSAGEKVAPLLNSDFMAEFAGVDSMRVLLNGLDVSNQLVGRDPVHQSMYLWSKGMLPNYILTVLGDRMEMAHSIEGRVPFLDHELVEAVARLPVAYKIKGFTEKHILREATRSVLTETIYKRQKHPFLAPPSAMNSRDPLFEMVQDTLRGPNGLSRLPFYNAKAVFGLLDALPDLTPAQRTAIDPLLMLMVSASVLGEHYGL